ncbi:MAG: cytochrome c [Gemmatimonadetes bacterium]|nr:cytochrome c [Gemmatimonadota bacterium]
MKWLRRLGIALAVLVLVLAIGAGTVYGVSASRLSRSYASVKGHAVTVHADSATIERGRHIATAVIKCVDCHRADFGGGLVVDDPAIGTVAASNVTTGAGGVLARYDDALLERAIRHGIGHDGRGLWIMPSYEVQGLADDDLAALIAYIRSLKPVDRTMPPLRLGPVGRALYVGGKLPLVDASRIAPDITHPVSMPAAPTAEYGKYAARVGGCFGCHGETLSGGPIPGSPPDWKPAANITPTGLQAYDEAAFVKLLKTGTRPAGTMVDSLMPYRFTKDLTPSRRSRRATNA